MLDFLDDIVKLFTSTFHASYEKGKYRKNGILTLYTLTNGFAGFYDQDLNVNIKKDILKEAGNMIGSLLGLQMLGYIGISFAYLIFLGSIFPGPGSFILAMLLNAVLVMLALAILNPFLILVTRKYKFVQGESKEVALKKLKTLNSFYYEISRKFFVWTLLPLVLAILFFVIASPSLPTGLTIPEVLLIFVIPIFFLYLFAGYLKRRMQTDLYEDALFHLEGLKYKISVTTDYDKIKGNLASIGSFLVLKNKDGIHAIEWAHVKRITLLQKTARV